MIKKAALISLIISLFMVNAMSQKKLLTIEDMFSNRKLQAKTLQNIQWIEASEKCSFVWNSKLVMFNAKTLTTDTLFGVKEFNSYIKSVCDTFRSLPAIKWIDEKSFTFIQKGKIYSFDVKQKTAKLINQYNPDGENADVNYKSFNVGFTLDNNIYVASNSKEKKLSTDGSKNIVYGKAAFRNEFGINKGIFWADNGNKLAFYRIDQTKVTEYPILDNSKKPYEACIIKYPFAGTNNQKVTVGIYDFIADKTLYLKTDTSKDLYYTNITFSPDGKSLYIAVLSRSQKDMQLNQYNAETGDFVKTLFEEHNSKYFEPEHGPVFLNSNPDQFIWYSKRDGHQHLYLYDTNGKLIKQLTQGKFEVLDIIDIDKKDETMFVYTNKDNPLERHIYSLNIKAATLQKLSFIEGTHTCFANSNLTYFLDIYNSKNICYEVSLKNKKGEPIKTIINNTNPLKDYNLGETDIFALRAKDSTELFCRMITPPNFSKYKKYPVIIYVYGGPHTQLVTNSWTAGAGLFLNYLAQQGYIVFTLDNRGSSNRGLDFEQAIHRNLSTIEIDDQMVGVNFLKRLNYVDTNRIGVHGWSYGGFMTVAMMTKQPNVFKAAVAGAPVIDWSLYEVMYGERYIETPKNNPEGFKNANLVNFAKDLKGKLLIVHGTEDETVVQQHSLMFIDECIKNNIPVDYFPYPGHDHSVRGKDRIHLYHKIENYFNDYLR